MIDVLQMGPFNIYIPNMLKVLSLVITAIFGFFIVKKLRIMNSKKAFDLIIEYWIVFIIVWKLSYFLLHPQDLINYPLSVIYFNGGTVGIAIGVLAVFGYIFYQYIKYDLHWQNQSLLFISALITFTGLNQLIKFLYVYDYLMLIESLSYILIVAVLYLHKNYHPFYSQLKVLRWFLILWVISRVINDEIDMYLIWLLAALVISTGTVILESLYTRKEKG